MRGAFLKTWLALIALAGLGGYVYWSEKHAPDTPKDQKPKVFTFDKAKLKELRIEPVTSEAIKLLKRDDGWHLQAATEQAAGTTEVDGLIAGMEALEVGDTVTESGGQLAEYGLQPPRTVATLVVDGLEQPLGVNLGSKTYDNAAVYAQRPGETKVFLIPAFLAGALDKRPFDLRDRDLLHVQRDKIKSVDISGPDGGFALERLGKDEWSLARPIKTRAARWPVDSLLGLLEGLRMESVVAEQAGALEPYGLSKPARTVSLTLDDGTQRRLEIGSATTDKKYHAREALSKLVALIPPALVDDLAKGAANLRAKRLVEVSSYDISGVEAKLAGQVRSYARNSSKGSDGFDVNTWKRTSPDPKDLETSKLEDVLFKLTGLEAAEFVDAPAGLDKYGLDAPLLELKLSLGQDKPAVTVSVGQKDGAVFGRRQGDDSLLKLDADKFEEARKALEEL